MSYGRGRKATNALIDFNLRVAAGETVALLGPSGSGKSTALNALAGFVRPTTGTVRLAGRDVTDLPPAKRGIGVVLQSYALFPHMRVADNVAFGLKSHRVPRGEIGPRVAEALDMVGMSAYGKRLPRELSGGQQQRVAIARALAIRPDRDFERSSAVLVRCDGRGLPGACMIGSCPAFPCCEVPRVGPGVAGWTGLVGRVRRRAVVLLGSR